MSSQSRASRTSHLAPRTSHLVVALAPQIVPTKVEHLPPGPGTHMPMTATKVGRIENYVALVWPHGGGEAMIRVR